MRVKKPENRKAEVLAYFMQHPKKKISYAELANELHQVNAHRYRDWLQDNGVNFTITSEKFTNRFGNTSSFKFFKLNMKAAEVRKIYKLINVKRQYK